MTEAVFLGRRTATASFILNKLHESGVSLSLWMISGRALPRFSISSSSPLDHIADRPEFRMQPDQSDD